MGKYKSLQEIAEALNNDQLQINELPEVIEASGFRQGDRDLSVAIDDQSQLIIMCNELKDYFEVVPYVPVEDEKKLITRQIDKIDEIIKELSYNSFLEEDISFLNSIKEDLAGYRDIL